MLDNQELNKQLIKAVRSNNIDKVRSLLEQGADINAVDNGENTALILATIKRNKDVIGLLLNHKANVDLQDIDGRTALV